MLKCFFFLLFFLVSQGFLPPKSGPEGELAEYPYKDYSELMVKRGIVELCCHKPCTLRDLQNYCN